MNVDKILKRRRRKEIISKLLTSLGSQKTANYVTIIGTVISVFFAFYAIILGVEQKKDKTNIKKLEELNTKLAGILESVSDAQNLSMLDLGGKITLDEQNYLKAQSTLISFYYEVTNDSAHFNIEDKLSVLNKIDLIVSSQLSNPIITREDYGIHWLNLHVGISSLFNELFFIDKRPKSAWNIINRNFKIDTSFPELISRLKLIVDDNSKGFKYSIQDYYSKLLQKYNSKKK